MSCRGIAAVVVLALESLGCLVGNENELPQTTPEDVGMSSERLAAVDETIKQLIEGNQFAGAVVAVARRGQIVHFRALGQRDLERHSPMQKDTIFTMRSMTKPLTCVAALILVDEGRLGLDDPIHDYFPSFQEVMVRLANGKRVRPNRPPSIRDLLRYTDGLPASLRSVRGRLPKPDAPTKTFEEWIDLLVSADLDFHPGERARYGISLEIMAGIIRKVTGQKLNEFMEKRIFKPLDMRDTAYHVPSEKRERLAKVYRCENNELVLAPVAIAPESPPEKGGVGFTGLYSTARDYLRFSQMLLNGGTFDGKKILNNATVAEMTSNQFPPGVSLEIPGFEHIDRPSFGFGVRVSGTRYGDERDGDFGWAGSCGTFFQVSPSEELVVILLSPRNPHDGVIARAVYPKVFAAIQK